MCKKYLSVWDNPGENAEAGDMTAMLYFTKPVFSYGNGKQLVSAFQDEIQKIAEVQIEDRMRANIEMFKRDLIKHNFDPDFDEYAVGFNLDVTQSLYRFLSILRHDLSVLLYLKVHPWVRGAPRSCSKCTWID